MSWKKAVFSHFHIATKQTTQMWPQIIVADYLDSFHLEFRLGYGTEIALIVPLNEFCMGGMGSALLDLSVASDAIDHGTLLDCSEGWGRWHSILLIYLFPLGSILVSNNWEGEERFHL